MDNWIKAKVSLGTTLKETIIIIEENAMQIALIVDEQDRLMGTVTDGDIRRGILKGIALEDAVEKIMNSNPLIATIHDKNENILSKLKSRKLRQIPIVDDYRKLVGLETLESLINVDPTDNIVVLMAGGLGSRLRPLTDDKPKPLLEVGGKPILETILESFIENGFSNFFIAVNYKSDMIRDYFGDGSKWGVNIDYIHEEKRMGTAGALSLLPFKPTKPFFVMNGDLLAKINFRFLLDFHKENASKATMCVREFEMQIPYGVVNVDKQRLIAIEEKPIHKSFVSAGVYVLDPIALDFIPDNTFYDMPTLFEEIISRKKNASVFPLQGYWCDIGRLEDYDKANLEFDSVFNDRREKIPVEKN